MRTRWMRFSARPENELHLKKPETRDTDTQINSPPLAAHGNSDGKDKHDGLRFDAFWG